MKNIYCTLFNEAYLVKGLALYSSMKRTIQQFILYILAMDEQTEYILKELNLENVRVIAANTIIDSRLEGILDGRVGPSLFWTCTPLIVEYVLRAENQDWCTYIDADCYFFANPGDVFDVMENKGYSVGVVEHRFRNDAHYTDHVKTDGRFNVAFNVFRNQEESLRILEEWKEQCLEQCTNKPTEGYFGDQLYLNEWPDRYNGVYIIENHGIDVAPWNVNNYSVTKSGDSYIISNDEVNTRIIMYHFHTMNYVTKHLISLNLWNTKSRSEISDLFKLYKEYIEETNKQQRILDRYFQKTEKRPERSMRERIMELLSKYYNRKENSILQIIRNIMWI